MNDLEYYKNLSDERLWNFSLMVIRGIMKKNGTWYRVSESHIQRKMKQIRNAKTHEQLLEAINLQSKARQSNSSVEGKHE
jgi:hypothetical protein